MKGTKLKVLVAGGGTGGHIYPGLAVIEALNSEEILYVGSRRGLEKKLIPNHGIRFQPVFAGPLMGQGLLGRISGFFSAAAGLAQSAIIHLRFRPRVILGTGGYVCVPVLLAGAVLRIPTFILEQNLLPGRSTRFLSRFASRVLVSFPESQAYLPHGKTIVTGNPVRPEIGALSKEESRRRLGIPDDFPVIAVMGASQGARALNRVLLEALPLLSDRPWQIIHLTGEKHYEETAACAGSMTLPKLRYKAFPYVEDMAAVYGACDFLVARAGATTLAEILQAGKPSLLIPYPHAADNHQEFNARWLEGKNACRVVLEKDFTPPFLAGFLQDVMSRPELLHLLAQNTRRAFVPGALEKILEVLRREAR